MPVCQPVCSFAFKPMSTPTSHSLEPCHKPQIHEPTQDANHNEDGMSEHIKYDEEYVHSEISGSIQCDPFLEPLLHGQSFVRHLAVDTSLERM